jgi:hypothetical protein
MDAGQRVLAQQIEVGRFAVRDGPAAIDLPNKLSGGARGGLESGERR